MRVFMSNINENSDGRILSQVHDKQKTYSTNRDYDETYRLHSWSPILEKKGKSKDRLILQSDTRCAQRQKNLCNTISINNLSNRISIRFVLFRVSKCTTTNLLLLYNNTLSPHTNLLSMNSSYIKRGINICIIKTIIIIFLAQLLSHPSTRVSPGKVLFYPK